MNGFNHSKYLTSRGLVTSPPSEWCYLLVSKIFGIFVSLLSSFHNGQG